MVIPRDWLITMLNCRPADACALSVALTENVNDAARVGVPEICPVVDCKARPAGNWPEGKVHVYGGTPPLACSVEAYGRFTIEGGREEVVTASDGGLGGVDAFLEVKPLQPSTQVVARTIPANIIDFQAFFIVGALCRASPRPTVGHESNNLQEEPTIDRRDGFSSVLYPVLSPYRRAG